MGILIIKSKKYGEMECMYDDNFKSIIDSFSWSLAKHSKTFYAITKGRRADGTIGTIRMHRLFIDGELIDHRDGNGLNNRIENLRAATKSQNAMNRGASNTNVTGYKGVYTKKLKNRTLYFASIRDSANVLKYLGSFRTAEEAALRFNQEVVLMHGEFAKLNII